MATYFSSTGGTTIKESGSLKRTTTGTTSKTVGAGEYALVSLVFDGIARVEGLSSGSESYEEGDAGSFSHSTLVGTAHNQFIVGGGITFSVTYTTGTGTDGSCSLIIDDCVVFSATGYAALDTAAAQYVIFE